MRKNFQQINYNHWLLARLTFICFSAFLFEYTFHQYIENLNLSSEVNTLIDSTLISSLILFLGYMFIVRPNSKSQNSTASVIINSMNDGVVCQDTSGKITGYNQRALDILNLNEDQILERTSNDKDWHAIHPDGSPFPGSEHPAMKALKTGTTQSNCIMGLKYSDSNIKWIRINSVPLFSESHLLQKKSETPHGVISTFTDISEDIKNKKELETMYERQVLSSKALNLGVWDWNLITDELIWDDKMYEIFEVDKKIKPMSGKYFFNQVVHPEDQNKLALIVNSTLKNKKNEFHSDFRIKTQSGLDKYIRANAICFYKNDGTPERLIGNNIDITQQVETEEKMNQLKIESENFFIIGAQPHCIAGLDGYFKRINPQFQKILGYTEEQILSKPFIEFVHPEDKESTIKQVANLSKGLSVINFENRYITASGEHCVINWTVTPDTNTGLLYCAARDVTEDKLQQTKLIQSSKMVTLGEMASGMAHEINNPLAAIQGRADQLLRMIKNTENIDKEILEKHLTTVFKMTERIAKIVRSLKNFSRKSDADPFLPTPIDLIINETMDLCSEKIKNYGIKLEICIDQNEKVQVRQSQISQVLLC